MGSEPGHSGKRTYVLTHDLPARFRALKQLGLIVPEKNHRLFTDFTEELRGRLSQMLPEVELQSIDMEDLSDKIWAQALKKQASIKDAVVISTCAEIAQPRRGLIIEINRIVDQHGKIVGLGPRPGHQPLSEQFRHFASTSESRPVVLVEDGAFSGKTMAYLLKRLKEHGVKVTTVVIGFCFPEAATVIKESFDGEVVVIEELNSPLDWMPDHDFVPLTPNCGRVIGCAVNGEAWPLYTHDGVSFSFPYVKPFGDPTGWASIPSSNASDFSLFCVTAALKIYGEINRNNSRRLTLREILGTYPRISIPFSLKNCNSPDLNQPVADFLSDVCQSIRTGR